MLAFCQAILKEGQNIKTISFDFLMFLHWFETPLSVKSWYTRATKYLLVRFLRGLSPTYIFVWSEGAIWLIPRMAKIKIFGGLEDFLIKSVIKIVIMGTGVLAAVVGGGRVI